MNKKKCHASKQPIGAHSVDISRIVISDKFKHNNEGIKYFLGYTGDDVIRPVMCCIALNE